MLHLHKYRYFVLFPVLLLLLSSCSGNDQGPETAVRTSSETASGTASESSSGTGSEASSGTTSEEASMTPIEADTKETSGSSDPETVTEAASDTEPVTETTTGDVSEAAADITTGTETEEQHFAEMNLVLATLNIKHGAEGLDIIAEAIREVSPDIIGLEEVDVNCERSGYTDEPAVLAELAGYPYYAFSKAINLGSGEYGTSIMSRYPIESYEVIDLESGNGENRSLGHAVLDVNGLEVHAFVTHLSYEDRTLRIKQMETIADKLHECEHYVLMGDFNCFNLEDIVFLGGEYYVNRPDRRYTTFQRFDVAIDNIVVSKDFTELSSGLSDKECSDHKLLYAEFLLSVG